MPSYPGSSHLARRDAVEGVERQDEEDTPSTRSSESVMSQRSRQARKRESVSIAVCRGRIGRGCKGQSSCLIRVGSRCNV